jgi:hypothetical protein
MMDEQFLVSLGEKVHRGQEERALKGMQPGGRCSGYHGTNGLPTSEVGAPDDDPGGNLVELFRKDLEVKMIYLVIGITYRGTSSSVATYQGTSFN